MGAPPITEPRQMATRNKAILLLAFTWACCASLVTACQPLQGLLSNSNFSAVLDGACHSACGSATSPNPALSLPVHHTWASAPPQLAALDLCNQVQTIWLMQGACGRQ